MQTAIWILFIGKMAVFMFEKKNIFEYVSKNIQNWQKMFIADDIVCFDFTSLQIYNWKLFI